MATIYDDPNLDMSDDEIARRNVRRGISEADPDEEARQAEVWDAIENGDIGLLVAMLPK